MLKRLLFFLLLGMFVGISCERVDFSEEEEQTEPEKPVSPSAGDDSLRAYTVAEAQRLYYQSAGDTVVAVVGYIVGVCGQYSMTASSFEPPFSIGSNILLADSPYERNYANCFPVRLPANSDIRSELNLVDHPELLGTTWLVVGLLEEYYRTPGMKEVDDWARVEVDNPGTEPADTTSAASWQPVIDSEAEVIYGGRALSLSSGEQTPQLKNQVVP